MYKEAKPFPSFWVGCNFHCVYCTVSFQRQMKRMKRRCFDCYRYTPHGHPERFMTSPPKTEDDEFIFLCDFGDVFFAPSSFLEQIALFCLRYPDRQFLLQSKGPECFLNQEFPSNVLLGTTMETNQIIFDTPSPFTVYPDISKAPLPLTRFLHMKALKHPRKVVTIEPILDFDLDEFLPLITSIEPECVYVGYDSHPGVNKLPEPPLENTIALIRRLREAGIEVREKTIREAWWKDS